MKIHLLDSIFTRLFFSDGEQEKTGIFPETRTSGSFAVARQTCSKNRSDQFIFAPLYFPHHAGEKLPTR